MAQAYKVLGQAAPSADTDTTLYTAPASTQTVVSTVSVCNRGSSAARFRVAVRPAGAGIANQHYVAYDTEILANDTVPVTIGITLGATDVITVRGNSANLSFSAFGCEIT